MVAPLKILESGSLKEMVISEEDYLAYRAGIHLSTTTVSDKAALNITSGATVGAYTDTFFSTVTVTPTIHNLGTVTATTRLDKPTLFDITWGSAPSAPTSVAVGDTIRITAKHALTLGVGQDAACSYAWSRSRCGNFRSLSLMDT